MFASDSGGGLRVQHSASLVIVTGYLLRVQLSFATVVFESAVWASPSGRYWVEDGATVLAVHSPTVRRAVAPVCPAKVPPASNAAWRRRRRSVIARRACAFVPNTAPICSS